MTKKRSIAVPLNPQAERELERRRDKAWLTYHSRRNSLWHLQNFAAMLRDDHDGTDRVWIQSAIAREADQRAAEISEILRLRASIERVSPVLLAACEHEDLPIAAIAYALLPFAHWPEADVGWPWAHDHAQFEEARAAAFWTKPYMYRDDADRAFVHRNRDDGTFMRGTEHCRGGWAASVRRGVLGTEMILSGSKLRTVNDRGTLTITAELPESAASAVQGRPVSDVVDHPVLRNPGLVMTSARVGVGSTTIRFRCPPVAADFKMLTTAPSDFRHGCDVALQAEHALLILLARELSEDDALPSAVHERLICRIRAHRPAVQFDAPLLHTPSLEWVENAMRSERRWLFHYLPIAR